MSLEPRDKFPSVAHFRTRADIVLEEIISPLNELVGRSLSNSDIRFLEFLIKYAPLPARVIEPSGDNEGVFFMAGDDDQKMERIGGEKRDVDISIQKLVDFGLIVPSDGGYVLPKAIE